MNTIIRVCIAFIPLLVTMMLGSATYFDFFYRDYLWMTSLLLQFVVGLCILALRGE